MLIQVEKQTAKSLKSLKIVDKETYDEIINRLISNFKKQKK